jgi:hypothetical protein
LAPKDFAVARAGKRALATRPAGRHIRRQSDATMLYGVVRDHVAALLDQARERSKHGFGYPRSVEREFEKFLACGLLCHGFVRVRFGDCLRSRAQERPEFGS